MGDKFSQWFESAVIWVVQALLVIVIVLVLADLCVLLWRGLMDGRLLQIESVPELQRSMQRAIAGALLVVLALELREALRNYFVEHRVRLEVILSLALIAAGRHIIQLDYEHTPGLTLIGIGALILALVAGLHFVRVRMELPVERRE